jgi:hypothetical protein
MNSYPGLLFTNLNLKVRIVMVKPDVVGQLDHLKARDIKIILLEMLILKKIVSTLAQ